MTPNQARYKFLEPRRTRKAVSGYASLGELICQTSEKIFTPPESITVSAASEKYVKISLAGAWADFVNTTAPYMVEPMNMTQSREHSGLVFVSSAQCGKTASLMLNVMAYNIAVTGMDMMIVCPTGGIATDFAVRRVNPTISNSTELKSKLLKVRNSDNQKRKQFKNGMLLTLAHPSKNELAGKPIGVVAITDYDRIDDDIDGEGSAFGLGSKRTETFGSYAMTIAESTPSRTVLDPKKILELHEAPPCTGIMALYNDGDRRMWYWPCPACDAYFTPNWSMIRWDEKAGSDMEQAATAQMECPHCQHRIKPDDRHEMQQWGYWKSAGQRSTIVSYWLDGTAAAFTTWPKLVDRYLKAKRQYDDMADEAGLIKFWNTDLGRPYVPKALDSDRTPETLMMRAVNLGERVVPEGVRFLLACVDVQKSKFVVQVHGFMEGRPADIVVVDRFDVVKSKRKDEDDDPYPVRPATYQEDWDLLTEQVMFRQYPLSDGSGRFMEVKLTVCDSGGMAAKFDTGNTSGSGGVTEKAYQFQRDLQRKGLANRFHLIRGAKPRERGKRVWIERPDSSDRGPMAIAKGDVPVLYFSSNEIKDILDTQLAGIEPGKGMIHFPDWLPGWFYTELCAERWDAKHGWVRVRPRNESWDLLYYAVGVTLSPLLMLDKVDWSAPPPYAKPWDDNPFVVTPEPEGGEVVRAFERPPTRYNFAEMGAQMG